MSTTLYVSFYHAKRIATLYIVQKYQKMFESTNMDLTHLYFLILLGFPVMGYGGSTIHKIVPFTTYDRHGFWSHMVWYKEIKIHSKLSMTYI